MLSGEFLEQACLRSNPHRSDSANEFKIRRGSSSAAVLVSQRVQTPEDIDLLRGGRLDPLVNREHTAEHEIPLVSIELILV